MAAPEHAGDDAGHSSAATWRFLVLFIAVEQRISERMAARPATTYVYEFLRFGMKQAFEPCP